MSNKAPNIRIRRRERPQDNAVGGAEPSAPTPDGHDPHRPVGYANPPKRTQFKKGQSGNPRGRPRRKKSLSTMLDEILYKQVEITEGGRRRKVAAVEALLKRQLAEAMKGDAKAFDRLFKLQQMVGSPDNEPDQEGGGRSPAEQAMLAELAEWVQSEPGTVLGEAESAEEAPDA
ncbi:DUF5681 domain-containing protein [Oceanicaulis alexandrii]|uniref:DUF5681 domain-containing protein n=1 Tax=Oceanicaulis alexandrii TaxID=153233 RepID=UPI0023574D26|nr:DUF5681 domain-containing protein [Oceanicaulis alexandrii]